MSEEEKSCTRVEPLPQKKKMTTTKVEGIELEELDLEESLKRKINLLQVREDEDHTGSLGCNSYLSDELKIFSHEEDEEEEECLEEGEEEELRAVLSEEKNSLIEETEGAPLLEGSCAKILPPLDLNTLVACSTAGASNSSASSTSSSIGMASNGRPSSSNNTLEAKILPGGGKSDSSPSSPLCSGYPLHSPYSSNGANNNNSSSSSSYINGPGATPPSSSGPPPLSMVRSSESPESPYLYNGNSSDPLGSPPPAHLGGLPYNLASDGGKGLRSALYSPPSVPPNASSPSPGYPYSLLGGGSGGEQFGGSCSSFSRFGSLFSSPGFHPPLPGELETIPPPTPPHHINHPILNGNHSRLSSNHSSNSRSLCPNSSSSSSSNRSNKKTTSSGSSGSSNSSSSSSSSSASSKTHIKKPLNAFMLYMKEMRPTIVAECTLKESAAINQILGRRWHGLSREEQAKYYESARKERQLHMQMYPGWSARDNYAQNKKKKRKREGSSSQIKSSSASSVLVNNIKKCRARYGMDQQDLWCKPCNPLTLNNNNNNLSSSSNNNSLNTTTPATPDPRELFLHHHHQSSQQQPGGGHAMLHGEDLTLDPRLNSPFLLHHHHHHHHHLTSSSASPISPPLQNQGSGVDHLSSHGQLDLSMSNTGSLPPPLAPLHDSTRSNHILDHHHPLESLKLHQHPLPPGGSIGDESSPKYISL